MSNESQHEDQAARDLMKKSGEVQPSADFTANFMARLREHVQSPQFLYKPIFSKRTWYWIGSIVLLTFIGALLAPSGGNEQLASPHVANALDSAAEVGSKVGTFFAGWGIWAIGIILIPLLYFTDKILRSNFKKEAVTND